MDSCVKLFNNPIFGHRRKVFLHSTIDTVSKFYVHVLVALESNLITLAVFLDLSKVFDTIDYNILLKKNYIFMVFTMLRWGGSGTISQTGPKLCHTITHTLSVITSPTAFPKEVSWIHSYSSTIQMIYHMH